MPVTLSSEMHTKMWSGVLDRLHRGEPLLTRGHFEDALVAEYNRLTDEPLPNAAREQLRDRVEDLHTQYPETYLAQGVRNAVLQAFAAGIERMKWTGVEIERYGWTVIRRFMRSESMRGLLTDFQVSPESINVSSTIRQVLDSVQSQERSAARRHELAATDAPVADSPVERSPQRLPSPSTSARGVTPQLNLAVSLAAKEAGIDATAAAARVEEQEQLRVVLGDKEMSRVSESLHLYVADGILDAPQAEQMGALLAVDAREQEGAIEAAAAAAERDLILTVDKRSALHAKVRTAVDATVGYIQVFESLKKISNRYDGLLKILVEHKEAVINDDATDRNSLLGKLSQSPYLLELAVSMMEREDSEIRLLAVRLPPYSQLVPHKLKPIANLTVDADFIDALRTSTAEDLSDRFHAEDARERARPAADILTLIHLLDHVIELTPFRMKLRMMMTNQVLIDVRPRLEELFAKGDPKEARRQADRVLRQRLNREISGASKEEQVAAQRRGQALLQALEQNAATEAEGGSADLETALSEQAVSEGESEEGLTEEERVRGVQMARVEVRVAGKPKKIPSKIMPDQDDPSKVVLVSRDPDTGELSPQMRRGKKRFVEQGRDSVWRAT